MASVSHELRTPLNGSINLIDHANQDDDVPIRVKETLLKPALYCNKILLHIVNDILDFSKMNANAIQLSFNKCNILEAIKEAQQIFSFQAKMKGVNIILDQ